MDIVSRNCAKAERTDDNKDGRSSTILPHAPINRKTNETPMVHPLHPFVYDRLREIAHVINGRILFVPIIVRR